MGQKRKRKLTKEERPIQVRTLRTKVTRDFFPMQKALYNITKSKTKTKEFFLCCMCRDTVCIHICGMSNIYANFCCITSHPLSSAILVSIALFPFTWSVTEKKTLFRRCCLVSKWCWLINKNEKNLISSEDFVHTFEINRFFSQYCN